jgi:hypothetical protein
MLNSYIIPAWEDEAERAALLPNPTAQIELSETDLDNVVGGGKGSGGSGFGRKLLEGLWAGSGFNPRNNEWWRTS